MTKNEIADVLVEIGTLLELQGENPFKVRAYLAGARALEAIEESELGRLIAAGELKSVKGIGDALAQKITELHTTGRLGFLERLRAAIAPGLVEMLQIPGLGPKKIRALHDRLGIADVAGLAAACTDGRVAEFDGFGARTQEKLLAGIRNREAYGAVTCGGMPQRSRRASWPACAPCRGSGGPRRPGVCGAGWRPSAIWIFSWRRTMSPRWCAGSSPSQGCRR
jgi:predicted flap endonuclease-1-like 5' DNA nuclease